MSEPTSNRILFASSEAFPLIKTGGLGDVAGSLPRALLGLKQDVHLILPAYTDVLTRAGRLKTVAEFAVRQHSVRLLSGTLPATRVPVLLVDCPQLYDRPGNPYLAPDGKPWPDNAWRYTIFAEAVVQVANNQLGLNWQPEVVHCNDWQTGLVPVYLHQHLWRDPFFAKTSNLFTIHNLGYQGVFPQEVARLLALDNPLMSSDGLEYFGQISLLKGGISFATRVNTVSPTYCREIQTPQHGMGLDGLLRSRADHLHGVLNGLDGDLWSPVRDKALAGNYSVKKLAGKKECKKQLQKELGLDLLPNTPMVAMVTRLDSQKGIELVLESWGRLMRHDLQLVLLGSGNPDFERRLTEAASYYPGKVSVLLQFDDALARRIYAGSDIFMMPSRYEPCGLGQLIALRYGSVPLVHATGGLADTITDPLDPAQRGNGFAFQEYRHDSFLACLGRALETYAKTHAWRAIMLRGMQQDFSWRQAAGEYVKLYRMCTRESR